MKLLISFAIISLITANFVSAQADLTPPGYTNYISQKLLTSGVEMIPDIRVDSSGESKFVGVEFSSAGGSRYELYTIRAQTLQVPFKIIPLANTTIGLFKTGTKLLINSDDPFNSQVGATGPRRTMAGKRFSVTAEVSGLETDLTKPRCFRFINLKQTMQSYLPTKTEEGKTSNPLVSLPTMELSKNGLTTLTYNSSLSDPTADYPNLGACGEEIFQAWTLRDTQLTGQTIPEKQLDEKRIQIWPKPSAEIKVEWKTPDKIVRTIVPSMTFTFRDVYPSGEIYVQVYPGPQKNGTNGVRIGTSGYINTDNNRNTPLKLTNSPDDFDSKFPTDGEWTVEVVASYPDVPSWNEPIISEKITVDRTFRLNTNLTTSE